MCDVCRSEEMDVSQMNGEKPHRVGVRLFRVYQGRVATINLCYLHTLELFQLGERRFLKGHIPLARDLAFRAHRDN